MYDIVNENVYQVYSKFRIQNSEFRIRNSEFGIRNSEFGIQNSDFRIQNCELLLTFKSYLQWYIGPILQCNSYVHYNPCCTDYHSRLGCPRADLLSSSLYSFHSEQAEQKSSALEHLCWRTLEYSIFQGGADRKVT